MFEESGQVLDGNRIILSFDCRDGIGIVASVTSFFSGMGFNIVESSQYQDPVTNRFFMRTEYKQMNGKIYRLTDIKERYSQIACRYNMVWNISDIDDYPRVLIAVSKWGHCLEKLLNEWKQGNMPIEIVGVVSNHESMRSLTDWYGLEYHYFSIEKGHKQKQENRIMELFESTRANLLVLARYMQILSDDTCKNLNGKAINIHHSFLPGFKGARPYHQAHKKGVKLIGATAHYVTPDLDEGPIIEQSIERVSHVEKPEDLVAIGRDVESRVLSRAVKWHAEKRVIVNGAKTVVFGR